MSRDERGALGHQAVVEAGGERDVDDLLHRGDRPGRHRRDPAGDGADVLDERRRADHAVEPADGQRFVGVDVAAGEDQVERAARPSSRGSRAVPPAPGRIAMGTSGWPSTVRGVP